MLWICESFLAPISDSQLSPNAAVGAAITLASVGPHIHKQGPEHTLRET